MSDPNLILKDTGSVEQTNRLVCMYAETIFQHEQTLCHKYQPKFQLSSSNTLGDMLIFVTKIEDQKGDRFLHLLVENLTLAEIV